MNLIIETGFCGYLQLVNQGREIIIKTKVDVIN